MGKPFEQELEKNESVAKWAFTENLDSLTQELSSNSSPIFIVGSGGSLSACYYAAHLFQRQGRVAKAVTPLEMHFSRNALENSNILFISASGRNKDILFGLKTALKFNPITITTLCMTIGSRMTELGNKFSLCRTFEFEIPSGKDGFLATNSLLAYFIFLHRTIGPQNKFKSFSPSQSVKLIDNFIQSINEEVDMYNDV